jgi:RHS repeat-associated protein
MCDSSGNIVARYDYDPYGRTTLVSGTNLSDFQYAGYYAHQPSGLYLTKYRAYDPNTARWLSRDPLPGVELSEGSNLYEYVRNEPINKNDPLGLFPHGYTPYQDPPDPYAPKPDVPDNGGGHICPCGQHIVWFFNFDNALATGSDFIGGLGNSATTFAGGSIATVAAGTATTASVAAGWNIFALLGLGGSLLGGVDYKCVPN